MEPLPKNTRRIYLALFAALFLITVPIAILYASGYRFDKSLVIDTIGGISLNVPIGDAEVSINGKKVGVSGIFNRNFFIDNLPPDTYALMVEREGYYPWYKTVIVEKQLVTQAQAFLIPKNLEVVRLVRSSVASTTASTTRALAAATYDSYLKVFATTTATTTQSGSITLSVEKGRAKLHYGGENSAIPDSFCLMPSSCSIDFYVTEEGMRVVHAEFFEGGVIYQVPEGVFIAEADARPTATVAPIYAVRGADFRIISGSLIIKAGTTLYEISGM